MALNRGDRGPKPSGAQAGANAEEDKQRGGQEPKEKDDVVVKMEKLDIDDDDDDDDDDYVHVKQEDLEPEGKSTEDIAAVPKAEDKGGAPLNATTKKNKKKHTPAAKTKSEAAPAVQIKSETAMLPDTVTSVAPKAEEKGGAPLNAAKKTKKKKPTPAAKTKSEAAAAATTPAPAPASKTKAKTKKEKRAEAEEDFLAEWEQYLGKRELADWQRLCDDLGLPGNLPSKTQCRKALETVHVNIRQFLKAKPKGEGGKVRFFENVRELAEYTRETRQRVPINEIPKKDPLRKLLREIGKYL
ncbi:hypothetical protein LX32DRAFT_656849 [Colletotrichum zoysiae]|uniref:Uncharacterized protein n=1 Tax=Colletotrichum zoysiae TaxID=1216348 RepID=A0AAD9LWS9_9PEZI|nr:hypothetical protein LX32DRAFT_656849 [Colletotrichum zoysiae]